MTARYDVIVIGGGPSGSTVAARLVQRGRRVLLLEKEHFPRFHIGESLLPCSMPLLEELGAMPALQAHGFLPKYAAEFVTADGSLTQRYAFADGLIPGAPSAFEVDRAEFDHLLLKNAARLGVDVREGTAVTRFDIGRDSAEVTARNPPPPPPDLVVSLPEPVTGTLRDRLTAATADPSCQSCHQDLNPIGFAFQNYDGVGKWRDAEPEGPVDASGTLLRTDARGDFANAVELLERIGASDDGQACFASQWLARALRRATGEADACVQEQVTQAFAASDGNLVELMVALARADNFRFRLKSELLP